MLDFIDERVNAKYLHVRAYFESKSLIVFFTRLIEFITQAEKKRLHQMPIYWILRKFYRQKVDPV